MLWRHLCLVRAGLAAGLVSGLTFIGRVDRDRPDETPGSRPIPSPRPRRSASRPRRSTLLQASKAGDLDVVARGQGPERFICRFTIVRPAG